MFIVNTPNHLYRIREKLNQLWQKWTEPVSGLSYQEYKRAHTVISVIFGSFLIILLIMVYVVLIYDPNKPSLVSTPVSLFMVLVMFIAYFISRTKYYKLGVYLYIYVPAIGVALNLLINYTVTTSGLFLFVPLFSSLLAKPRDTVVSGFVCLILAVGFYVMYGSEVADADVQLMITTITMATAITTFVSVLRESNLRELEGLNNQLQDQVILTDEARQEAEQANRIKSAFLASMSHELRTPLNSIINFTRFVADGDLGEVNEGQKELLTEVVGGSKHLLALINDVLDISKIEAGSLSLFIEDDVNINQLIENAISTSRGLLLDKDVELKVDIAENLPLIRADKQRILQILLNILSNACKFTLMGEIKVKVYREKDEIIVSVADTGPGIAPEDYDLVFESFRQTHTGLRQGSGTGLGMPIAKSLAEAHGGRLWLESVHGKGATFSVALPISPSL